MIIVCTTQYISVCLCVTDVCVCVWGGGGGGGGGGGHGGTGLVMCNVHGAASGCVWGATSESDESGSRSGSRCNQELQAQSGSNICSHRSSS